MNLKYFILIVFIFFSCKKKEIIKNSPKSKIDSSSYYFKLYNLNKSNNSKSIYLLKKSNYSAVKSQNTLSNRNILSDITFEFYNLNLYGEFYKSSEVLLKKSLKTKDSINIGKAYRSKAAYFKEKKYLDSSFYFYVKSEKLYSKLKNKITLGSVLLYKGIIQYEIGDYIGAELSLKKANNLLSDTNENEKIFGILNQLGLVYNELNEFEKAIYHHKKALELINNLKLNNQDHKQATCYNNLGYLYLNYKKYDEAIKNFELGLKDKTILKDDPDLYALLIDNLALSRLQIREFQDLPNLFLEGLSLRKELNSPLVIINSYNHISEYYHITNNKKLALQYSDSAIYIAKKSKTPLNLLSALKQASIVDNVNSYKYSEEYNKIKDSLQLAERNSKDRFARIELDTEEIIQKNGVLETRNRNLLLVFIITVIILGLLFVVRAQRAKTRELLYKQAQQKANEEIYNLMISQQAVIDENRTLEKKRLAQDLHDGVLGRMFGLRLNLDSLNHSTDDSAPQKRNELLNELKTIEQDIREISHDLSREKQELVNNFVSIVHNLMEEQKVNHGSEVELFVDKTIPWDKFANNAKINLYRMLQEGLQNINKYAQAKNIIVEIKKIEESVSLMIKDDGVGFDVSKKAKGIGMQNMLSRTKECGGIISVESKKGAGTKIEITIPIEIKLKEPKTEKTINIETINT